MSMKELAKVALMHFWMELIKPATPMAIIVLNGMRFKLVRYGY